MCFLLSLNNKIMKFMQKVETQFQQSRNKKNIYINVKKMILGPRGEDQMLAMCIYVHRRRNFQHLASERRLCLYVQISSVFHFNKLCKFVLTFCVYFCLFLGIELFYVCCCCFFLFS